MRMVKISEVWDLRSRDRWLQCHMKCKLAGGGGFIAGYVVLRPVRFRCC